MKRAVRKIFAAALGASCCLSLFSCGKTKVNVKDESSEESSVQQTTDADEAELGPYVVSSEGTKLYYEDGGFPEDFNAAGLAAALEKYFISFSKADYDSYLECLYPGYVSEMEDYLSREFGYGLDKSFATQCENLKNSAGGDFTVTRIKIEASAEDASEKYLDRLGESFGNDFYDTVTKDCDAIHDVIFYVMVESGGMESLIVSEYEIVFAEKDGKLYTFG